MEIFYVPGIFIGLPLLDNLCIFGVNPDFICTRDFGSATSSGERIFIKIGSLLFITPLILYILKKIFSKNKFLDFINIGIFYFIFLFNYLFALFISIIGSNFFAI